jgi:L,D-peptidoglycan transpeptidase YkuD (ErfK/YbiS/YcfS/YnhG family)
MRVRAVVAACLVGMVLAGGLAGTSAASGGTSKAATRSAASSPAQVVTVRASNSSTTYALLEVWSRRADGRYRREAGPWRARVGYSGVGRALEGSGRTPAGVWALGQAFGVGTRNPGTAFGWFTADARDAWGSDVGSPATYNRHVRCRSGACPFRESHAERLIRYPRAYRYAIFIRYNAPPHVVVGAGSAFFLHVGTGGATAGCVSVPASQLVWLLRHLRPGAVISIGVGARAYGPVPIRII